MVIYPIAASAMAGWKTENRYNKELPFYVKHRVSGTMKWCDVENDTGTVYDCFNTEFECNNFLQTENYVATDTCLQQFVGDTIEESYIEFVVTLGLANELPGMTVGTYTLKGGDGGASYSSNFTAMTTAFGINNGISECRFAA